MILGLFVITWFVLLSIAVATNRAVADGFPMILFKSKRLQFLYSIYGILVVGKSMASKHNFIFFLTQDVATVCIFSSGIPTSANKPFISVSLYVAKVNL